MLQCGELQCLEFKIQKTTQLFKTAALKPFIRMKQIVLKFSENIQNFTISINYYLNIIHREYKNIPCSKQINLPVYMNVDDFKSHLISINLLVTAYKYGFLVINRPSRKVKGQCQHKTFSARWDINCQIFLNEYFSKLQRWQKRGANF